MDHVGPALTKMKMITRVIAALANTSNAQIVLTFGVLLLKGTWKEAISAAEARLNTTTVTQNPVIVLDYSSSCIQLKPGPCTSPRWYLRLLTCRNLPRRLPRQPSRSGRARTRVTCAQCQCQFLCWAEHQLTLPHFSGAQWEVIPLLNHGCHISHNPTLLPTLAVLATSSILRQSPFDRVEACIQSRHLVHGPLDVAETQKSEKSYESSGDSSNSM